MPALDLRELARPFGIELTDAQLAAFEMLYHELLAWNTRVNLTAITEREQVIVKHFLDALSVAPHLPRTGSPRVIDVGTGAGLPGIPLKIALPHLRLTLVETTGKKVEFLQHAITQLALRDTLAIQARAEDLGHDPTQRAQYDAATARAVANLATLLEYTLPFVRVGGIFIAQKGIAVTDELAAATRALAVLGGRVREIVPVQLPGLEPRHLILIEKIAATPASYPRRAGTPTRKPL